MHTPAPTRRRFLAASAAALAALPRATADHPRLTPPPRGTPASRKIAVVATAYHYLSHAYHIAGRFLNGYLKDGRYHYPDFAIAGLHVEQQKANDLGRDLARKHNVPLFDDPARALTLGADKLAVDGVLLIAEHGDYPYNARLQKLYPRYELFQKIVAIFEKTGRVVPVFIDKHLGYDRAKAVEMVATAKRLNIPLFAGSSLPITWRRPEFDPPLGCDLRRGLVVTRGEIEIFGFHGLEALQCMMERRRGGETGVKSVQCVEGDAAWKLIDNDKNWLALMDDALSRSPSRNNGDAKENCRHFQPPPGRPTFLRGPIVFQVRYNDGALALVVNLNGHVDDTTFAGIIDGKPRSTLFYLPPPPGAAFLEALTRHIETFLATGKPPYPIERTLLTTAMLDAVLESREKGHREMALDDIKVRYEAPRDSGFMRGDDVRN